MHEREANGALPCCLNCSFFHWYVPGGGEGGGLLVGPVSADYRNHLRAGGLPATGKDVPLKNGFEATFYCKKGVWHGNAKVVPRVEWTRDRSDLCFFYPYDPVMDEKAAHQLERRAADRREAKKDRHLTRRTATAARRTAIAAIIVALMSALISLSTFTWNRLSPQDVQIQVKSMPHDQPSSQAFRPNQ